MYMTYVSSFNASATLVFSSIVSAFAVSKVFAKSQNWSV